MSPRPGRVDQAGAVARHQQRVVRGVGGDDGHRPLHRQHGQLGRVCQRRVALEHQLVVELHVVHGDVGVARAERHRLAEAGGAAHEVPEVAGPGRVVALVLQVALDQHVARPHQPGDGGDAVGVGRALLEPQVEGVEQVGGGGRAVGDQLTLHRGPVHQPGQHRVDRVAPAVAGEVGARDHQHPGGRALGVEVVGGVAPVVGDRLGPAQVLGHEVAGPQRRQRQQRHGHHPDGEGPPGAGPAAGQAGDPGAGQDRQRQRHQGHGPGQAAHGQADVGQHEGLDPPGPGRAALPGVGAHRQGHAQGQQRHEVGPVAPAGHHRAGQARDGDHVGEGQQRQELGVRRRWARSRGRAGRRRRRTSSRGPAAPRG